MRSAKKQVQKTKCAGFSLIELLIVVAIILIIASIAIPNLMRARIAANESAGAYTVRSINTAEATYSTTYASAGYAPNLTILGPNGANCMNPASVTATSACVLDSVVGCSSATCNKSAYAYTVSSSTTTAPVPDYFVKSISLGPALATKDFCSAMDEVIRFQPHTAGSDIAGPSVCTTLPAVQ